MKWPKRDKRRTAEKLDYINFNLLSPYTVSRMFDGISLLDDIERTAGITSEIYSYQGLAMRASALRKGRDYYRLAIDKFMGNSVLKRLEGQPLNQTTTYAVCSAPPWVPAEVNGSIFRV